MFGNKQPPAHSPPCSPAQGNPALKPGEQSGQADSPWAGEPQERQPAQASLSTSLGKDNAMGPPSPRGLCQHCLQHPAACRPHLALPFVHLLSSDLTASIAVGRELPASRADGSNLLSQVLRRRQIS